MTLIRPPDATAADTTGPQRRVASRRVSPRPLARPGRLRRGPRPPAGPRAAPLRPPPPVRAPAGVHPRPQRRRGQPAGRSGGGGGRAAPGRSGRRHHVPRPRPAGGLPDHHPAGQAWRRHGRHRGLCDLGRAAPDRRGRHPRPRCRPGAGPPRRVGRARGVAPPQAGRHRGPPEPGPDHARLRPERRHRPGLVRAHRARAGSPTRGSRRWRPKGSTSRWPRSSTWWPSGPPPP